MGGQRTMSSREADRCAPEGASISGVLHELPRWAHYIWLIYLGFLFTPLLDSQPGLSWLWPTLLSLPVFLYLYTRVIRAFRHKNPPGLAVLPEVLVIGVLAYALRLVNYNGSTYLIYCMALTPFAVPTFRALVLTVGLLLAGYALELSLLGFEPLGFSITAIVGLAAES